MGYGTAVLVPENSGSSISTGANIVNVGGNGMANINVLNSNGY